MSSAAVRKLTSQEYLVIERAASSRSEFYQGEMFAMAGASWAHSAIRDNIAGEARAQLKESGCRAVTSEQRVKVSVTGLYTYPDVVIVCDPKFEDGVFDTLLNPLAIVEVLSKSTAEHDRSFKFDQYAALPTVKEYILVAQESPRIEQYVRQEGSNWNMRLYNSLNETFRFSAIKVEIPLTEIYRDVVFSSPESP